MFPFLPELLTNTENTFCQSMSKYGVQSRVENFSFEQQSWNNTHFAIIKMPVPSVFYLHATFEWSFFEKIKWKLFLDIYIRYRY